LFRSGSESPAIRHDLTPQSREKGPRRIIVSSAMNFVGRLDRLAAWQHHSQSRLQTPSTGSMSMRTGGSNTPRWIPKVGLDVQGASVGCRHCRSGRLVASALKSQGDLSLRTTFRLSGRCHHEECVSRVGVVSRARSDSGSTSSPAPVKGHVDSKGVNPLGSTRLDH